MENPEDTESISISVRHTHDGALIRFDIPEHLKESFIRGIRQGSLELESGSSLEMSVLGEFVTDDSDRQKLLDSGLQLHLNVPICKILF